MLAPSSPAASARSPSHANVLTTWQQSMALLTHLWLPTLSVLGLSLSLAQTLESARIFVPGLLSLMAGVLLVYTCDRLLEVGRVAAPLRGFLWLSAAVSAMACVICAALWPARLFLVQGLLGIAAGLYVWLKHYAAAKTSIVAATWCIACSLLPIQQGGDAVPYYLVITPQALSIALMVAAGAIMCDYKDEVVDRAAHVWSLPLYLGHGRTVWLTSLLALMAALLAYWVRAWSLVATAALICMLGLRPSLLARPLLGPVLVDGVLALSGPFSWLMAS